jgi:hypothetical protein
LTDAKMNGAAKTSSVRLIPKFGIALGATLLLLFAALLAAPGAQALGSSGGEAGASTEQASAPPAGEATPAGEAPAETPPEETKQAPPPEETEQAPPPEETKQAPPPEETKQAPPPEETKQAPPPEETQAPPLEKGPEVKEAPPTLEETPSRGESAGRAASEGPSSTSNTQAEYASQVDESTASPSVVTTLLAGAEPEFSKSRLNGPAVSGGSRNAAGRGAGTAGCGPSSVSTSGAGSCAGLWLSMPGQPGSSVPVVVSGSWPTSAIDGGAVAGSGQPHAVALDNPPSTPRPGPTPDGSGGVAAAGGGSGAACSALTSVGASLRIARIASRHRLVAQPSWRTPFFVLIPERPG